MKKFLEYLFYAQLLVVPYLTVTLFTNQPVFAYVIDTPKWIFLYASAAVFLLAQLIVRSAPTLEYSRKLLSFVALYAVGLSLVVLRAPLGNLETVLVETLLFLAFVFWTDRIFRSNKNFYLHLDRWNLISFLLVTLPIAISVFGQGHRVLPFFGSPTMFGEFLGISLTFQIYSLFYLPQKDRRVRGLRVAALVFGLSVLFFIRSRAPMVGLVGVGLLYGFLHFSRAKKKKMQWLWLLPTVVALGTFFLYRATVYADKASSVSVRLIRWKNTLHMIKDHPFGVGLGNFGSTYTRYQNTAGYDIEATESMIIGNPHNAFLEVIAENGWLAALIVFAGLAFLARALYLRAAKQQKYSALALGALVFWVGDAFFNFPQDTPYGLLMLAIGLGIAWVELADSRFKPELLHYKITCGVLAAILIYFPAKRFYSEHLAYVYMTDNVLARKACELDSQNWRACLRKVSILWDAGKKEAALDMVDSLSARFPGQYVVHKKIIELLWVSGDRDKSCSEMKIYDARFNDVSSVHKIILDYCPLKAE